MATRCYPNPLAHLRFGALAVLDNALGSARHVCLIREAVTVEFDRNSSGGLN